MLQEKDEQIADLEARLSALEAQVMAGTDRTEGAGP
jgi:hypothetical protein